MSDTLSPSTTGLQATAQDSLENRYYAFLRENEYSSGDALKEVLSIYVPWFRGYTKVADLGCGHGEFLALLRDAGHTVSGVDVDAGMVEAAQGAGFDVALGDAVSWLQERSDSLDAVFSSNVVEHLPPETVAQWLRAGWDALCPGGMLLFSTPNPESAIVHLYEFWRDPTHVRLYNRQLLEFMLRDAGFEGIESHPNPASAWEGVDHMLAGVTDPLPNYALPERPASVPDLPTGLGDSFPLHKRLLWRLLHPLYRRLTAPFVEPIRVTVEQQRLVLEQARAALATAQAQSHLVTERLQRVAAAERFLYPPREYFVVGYKPGPRPARDLRATETDVRRIAEVEQASAAADALPPPS